MPYFSRLTDIVTCSLTALLQQAEDPQAALEEIIREMREGEAGAQRSVKTASENVTRLEAEIDEQRQQLETWVNEAKQALRQNDETGARRALMRKHEGEDLIAGLEQQLQAAVITRDHLMTTHNALRARLADAIRRRGEFEKSKGAPPSVASSEDSRQTSAERTSRVDAELEELRRQLEQGPKG